MYKKFAFIFIAIIAFVSGVSAQADRWQQRIDYKINATLDVATNIIKGTEDIVYTNNSTDTLKKVYFHLYWNAFQPNSSMDVRSRELGKNTMTSRRGDVIKDWDARVTDRIQKLTPAEIGYQRVSTITINGKAQKLIEHETILEVQLTNPIAPKTSAKLSLVFEAQVPKQIRRSGRDNAEGVRFSMNQKYRHYTTSKYYKTSHAALLGLFAFSQFLVYPIFIAALILTQQYILLISLWALRLIVQGSILRGTMKKLNELDLWPWFVLFDFWSMFYYLFTLPSVWKAPQKNWN